jgi:transposase-like protein
MDLSHDARIALALAEIGSENKPNYAEYARKYGLDQSTLSRRHRGKTNSRKEATSEYRQSLITLQEETLIRHLNGLSEA